MNAAFWRGKRVLVTGHTGFKGSWLCLWLQQLGAEVTGFALAPPTGRSLFEDARVAHGMTSVVGDIRDAGALDRTVAAADPEIVLHLAAQALVRYSYENPVETYATNVLGLVHLLESVRRLENVRAVVNVTSDKAYENREWLWGYRETDPVGGYDPYSSSKACAELVTAAYRSSYLSGVSSCLGIASARAGNVIGGGDWATDRLVPDIVRAFERNEPVIIRNPAAIRPWQHVLEPLSGYLKLAERLHGEGRDFAEAWNFGPADHDARPVLSIVEQIGAIWGPSASWQVVEQGGPHEAHYLKLDNSKAINRLGWRPTWELGDALRRTAEWYRARASGGSDMRDVTVTQILEFQAQRDMKNARA